MIQINKRQIEVQKVHLDEEVKVLKKLKKIYEKASKDCGFKIRELSTRTDLENIQSIVWQKNYQEILKKQLDNALDTLNSSSFSTIAEYLATCYENGFYGTLYDLQGQGVPLCFSVNQEEIINALQVDSKLSKGLYESLGEDIEALKKSVRTELSRGIANGATWNRIAGQIADGMNSPFTKAMNRSMNITRTEGHRVQQQSAFDCQQKAKSKGADVVKQWDSTLDSVTRPTHKKLDEQIREIDEPFEVDGLTAMYPGGFGLAKEDCNCRCCLLQRARWALSDEEYYTKWDGDKNELVRIKAKGYNEFKEKSKKRLMMMQFPYDVYKIKGLTKETKEELETALLKLKSEYDIKLNSIIVEPAGRHDIFITGYHDGIMDMVINQNVDFDRIIQRIPENYKSGRFAGKSIEDYIAHEMAHVMLYQDCTSDSMYKARYQQVESLYDSLKGISLYADKSKSGNEALAEAFVRVRNNETVAPIVKILVDSYFRKWKK